MALSTVSLGQHLRWRSCGSGVRRSLGDRGLQRHAAQPVTPPMLCAPCNECCPCQTAPVCRSHAQSMAKVYLHPTPKPYTAPKLGRACAAGGHHGAGHPAAAAVGARGVLQRHRRQRGAHRPPPAAIPALKSLNPKIIPYSLSSQAPCGRGRPRPHACTRSCTVPVASQHAMCMLIASSELPSATRMNGNAKCTAPDCFSPVTKALHYLQFVVLSSQVGNLAYMCRLGLWGPGSAFKDFEVGIRS